MKFLYLSLNLSAVIVPFLVSFHPRIKFYKRWRAFLTCSIISAAIFICWDIYFTSIGVWGFSQNYITGIHIANLPVEEVMFFFCIPFACIFSYHSLNLFSEIHWPTRTEKIIYWFLISVLLITAIINYDKLYTVVTFISAAILIAFMYISRISWLGNFIRTYLLMLIPFFIINGILTGSGLSEPIVWYNNLENIGIRLFTIPIEDMVYGFELILLNIYIYELYLSKFTNTSRDYIYHLYYNSRDFLEKKK